MRRNAAGTNAGPQPGRNRVERGARTGRLPTRSSLLQRRVRLYPWRHDRRRHDSDIDCAANR